MVIGNQTNSSNVVKFITLFYKHHLYITNRIRHLKTYTRTTGKSQTEIKYIETIKQSGHKKSKTYVVIFFVSLQIFG